jgi:hypothetical protein
MRVWVLSAGLLAASCGGEDGDSFACASSGAEYVELCYNQYQEESCADFDEDEVNGATWTFYPDSTCADLGYTIPCGDEYTFASSDPQGVCDDE